MTCRYYIQFTLAVFGILFFIPVVTAQPKTPFIEPVSNEQQFKAVIYNNHSFLTAYPFQLQQNGAITAVKGTQQLFTSAVKNHKLQGSWQSWYINGQLLDEGTLKRGIPDGVWKVWDTTGNLIAIRTYDADLFHRVKDELLLNHPRRSLYPLTDKYKKEGRRVAGYLAAAYSFQLQQAHVTDNLQQLVEKNAAQNHPYQPVFQQCLHHGLYVNYYANGQVKDSGYYKAGLRNGVWLHRRAEGIWKGAYKNSTPVHEWKLYNTAGKLTYIIFYNRNGKEERRKYM